MKQNKIKTVVKEVLRRDIIQQVSVMVAVEWLATDRPERDPLVVC